MRFCVWNTLSWRCGRVIEYGNNGREKISVMNARQRSRQKTNDTKNKNTNKKEVKIYRKSNLILESGCSQKAYLSIKRELKRTNYFRKG